MISMLSAPMFAAAMAINMEFQWVFPFLDQTNTAGSLSGQENFNLAYAIFDKFGLAEDATMTTLDGCHANASTRKYAGLDARGDKGESMVAYWNRHRAERDKQLLLRIHCICHLLALCVGDMMIHVPKFFTKHLRKCWSLVGKSAQRRAKFNHLASNLQDAINDCRDLFSDIEATYGMPSKVGASPKK